MAKNNNASFIALVPIAILIGVLLGGFLALTHKRSAQEVQADRVAATMQPAPPLNLIRFTNVMSQKRFDLKEMRGEKVLVNFFASWCVPCVAEIPELQRIARQNALSVVGVAYNDNYDAVSAFLDKYGNAYSRVTLDPMGHAAIDWGVRAVPESYLVDEKGNLVAHYPGPINAEVWATVFAPHMPPPVVQ